jgi:hypothetical protein
MPRKLKPTHTVRIQLAPPTRWSQLTDAEIDALPAAEKKELIREELKDLRAALSGDFIRQTIAEVGASQSELYATALGVRQERP